MNKKVKISFNIIAIICILLFCIAITPVTLQNDTFYTIRIGEHILENGIDMHDPFSIHDLPYTYPHWLYDVCIYLIYSVFGMTGIYISTILLTCILGILMYTVSKKIVKNDLVSFVSVMLILYVLIVFIAARAQLLTYIMFTLQILFIEKFIETKKKRYAIGLIILPIIIANVHSAVWPFYFVLFLPYIAEYLIAVILDSHLYYKASNKILNIAKNYLIKHNKNKELVEKIENKIKYSKENFELFVKNQAKRRENPYKLRIVRKDNVKWLILIMVICLFTGFLTPIGDTPYTYLIKTLQGNTTKSINEHLPLVLAESKDTITIIAVILAILIFTDVKIRLKDFFMLGGLIALTFMSKRQLSMLALIGIYSINKLLCDLFDKYDPEGTENFIKMIVSGFGRVITLLLVVLISILFYRQKINDKYIDEKAYPIEAAKYIKENMDLEKVRFYNEYNYGSYLLYEGIPVFIDSRCDLYTPQFNGDENKDIFSDFVKVSALSVHYDTIFDKYDITHLIIPNNAKMDLFLSKDDNYKEIYKDEHFKIYERLNK